MQKGNTELVHDRNLTAYLVCHPCMCGLMRMSARAGVVEVVELDDNVEILVTLHPCYELVGSTRGARGGALPRFGGIIDARGDGRALQKNLPCGR